MSEFKHSVLFLSNSPYNLHLVAESFARAAKIDSIDFQSAPLKPIPVKPVIESLLRNFGLELPVSCNHSMKKVKPYLFDMVISLGDDATQKELALPTVLPHFHWQIPELNLGFNGEATSKEILEIMDMIKKNIDTLFNSDFLNTLFVARRHQKLILDNMLDGVMAHTEKRIIFFFNKAAEKITNMSREEVLGKDCHDVFSNKFCGGKCSYCSGPNISETENNKRVRVDFKRKDGSHKTLDMLTLPLSDESDKNIGALVMFKDETELESLKSHLKHHHSLDRLITRDPQMLEVFEQIKEVSSVQVPVLIEGESGTGKELVASAIHNMSPRANKPIVAVNCGALPEGILESELFGHVKGAFTGAIADKKGRFELAHKGTLFLDEVAELSPAMQVKLLRALQEKSFERVGGEASVHVDIRIISATNQDLKVLMKKKLFRRDLYYRLCVVPIKLPPLRDRKLDIQVLVEYFLDLVASETERTVLGYTSDVIDAFSAYAWPGNIRELRNAIEYAYVKSRDSVIRIEHLPPEITSQQRRSYKKPGPSIKIEKDKVLNALNKTNGNRKEAAKYLGIGRATLYRYLEAYDLR